MQKVGESCERPDRVDDDEKGPLLFLNREDLLERWMLKSWERQSERRNMPPPRELHTGNLHQHNPAPGLIVRLIDLTESSAGDRPPDLVLIGQAHTAQLRRIEGIGRVGRGRWRGWRRQRPIRLAVACIPAWQRAAVGGDLYHTPTSFDVMTLQQERIGARLRISLCQARGVP